jgi:signal transduction histidine kinase
MSNKSPIRLLGEEEGGALIGATLNAEALREGQKLISIGRLAAEIAHEINNPLESVSNLLYLAQCEPDLPEKAAEYLRGAERELARVIQISKQTLSFHRESNQPVKIHMAELMDEVLALYARRLQQKKIRIVREYQTEQTVTALPGEIRQVLSNLVTNAIEASSMGGKLRLRIRPGREGRGTSDVAGLRITVADSGSGIPEAARKRLGELFFTTKGQSGTGLGLWVTKAIVSRYGGTIQLKSRTGAQHGTVFSIFLPYAPSEGVGDVPVARTLTAPASSRRRNVTEISNHPSHHDNHGVTGVSQKRSG